MGGGKELDSGQNQQRPAFHLGICYSHGHWTYVLFWTVGTSHNIFAVNYGSALKTFSEIFRAIRVCEELPSGTGINQSQGSKPQAQAL